MSLTLVVGRHGSGKTTVCGRVVDASVRKELYVTSFDDIPFYLPPIDRSKLSSFCENKHTLKAKFKVEQNCEFEVVKILKSMRNGNITIDCNFGIFGGQNSDVWREIRFFVNTSNHYDNNITLLFNGFGSVPNAMMVLCDKIRLHNIQVGDLQRAENRYGSDGNLIYNLRIALDDIVASGDRYGWRMVCKSGQSAIDENVDCWDGSVSELEMMLFVLSRKK